MTAAPETTATTGAEAPRNKAAWFTREGAAATSGPGSAAMPRKPRRLCASDLTRPGRFATAIEERREHERRQYRKAQLDVDEVAVENVTRQWVISEVAKLAGRAGVEIDAELIVRSLGESWEARRALREIAAKLGVGKSRHGTVDPDDFNANVHARCLRETEEWREIVAALTSASDRSSYRLAIGVLEAMMMDKGDFEVRRQWRSFVEMNLIRAWGYDFPYREDPELAAKPREKLAWRSDCALSEQGVCSSLFGTFKYLPGRDAYGHERLAPLEPVTGGLLNRAAILDVLYRVNAKVIAKLTGTTRTRRVGLDGLKIRAGRLQRQSVSPADEEMVNRALGCDMGDHNGEYWRGWMWLTLFDLDAPGIVYAWVLVPASTPEHTAFNALMAQAYSYMPWLNITLVAGDSAFDLGEETSRCAEQVWGAHPVFTRRGTIGGFYDFAADEGIPRCHGRRMLQVSCDHFYDAGKRRGGLRLDPKVFPSRAGKVHKGKRFDFDVAAGEIVCDSGERFPVASRHNSRNEIAWYVQAPPGVDIAPLVDRGLLPRAVIKWQCGEAGCANRQRTYPAWEKVLGRRAPGGRGDVLRTGWRVFTWAPRHPVAIAGREDRYRIREDAVAAHFNRVEGFNGEMRDRGVTMDGQSRPKPVKTDTAMRWLLGLRALRHNLALLVASDGGYEAARLRAEADDLLRAPDVADLEAHRARRAARDAAFPERSFAPACPEVTAAQNDRRNHSTRPRRAPIRPPEVKPAHRKPP